MMATDQERQPSQASLEVMISKLLEIAAELCLISDGFFVDRFENDVYPILVKLLGDYLRNDNGMHFPNKDRLSFAKQRDSVLFSILHCLKCAFESSCRFGLVGLIPPAGTILLPMLSLGGRTGDAVVDTLKAMLAVDCDALWRGLQQLHGMPFPSNPICASETTYMQSCSEGELGVVLTNNYCMDDVSLLVSKKAGKLLEFIEKLPEQQIH